MKVETLAKVLDDKILVRPIKQDVSDGGIVLPEQRVEQAGNRAIVLAHGPGHITRDGTRVPIGVKVNDIVHVTTAAADCVILGREKLYVLSARDILLIEA